MCQEQRVFRNDKPHMTQQCIHLEGKDIGYTLREFTCVHLESKKEYIHLEGIHTHTCRDGETRDIYIYMYIFVYVYI